MLKKRKGNDLNTSKDKILGKMFKKKTQEKYFRGKSNRNFLEENLREIL